MPISRQARMIRTAISPRFAMSTFLNMPWGGPRTGYQARKEVATRGSVLLVAGVDAAHRSAGRIELVRLAPYRTAGHRVGNALGPQVRQALYVGLLLRGRAAGGHGVGGADLPEVAGALHTLRALLGRSYRPAV